MTARKISHDHDLDLGVSGAMSIGAGGKRRAANSRQREAAAKEAAYAARREADMEEVWGRQRTGR